MHDTTFGHSNILLPELSATQGKSRRVVAFGTGWGAELKVPKNANSTGGGFSADWILALLSPSGEVEEFVPIEVQSMDTTGSYEAEWCRMMGKPPPKKLGSPPGLNWENVNKRIITQLLTKGNVFRRESLCRSGLFFICPAPVFTKLQERLVGRLQEYSPQSGALTFRTYELEPHSTEGSIRKLIFRQQFTTTVDNLKEVYNSTQNLPERDIMGKKLQQKVANLLTKGARR